MEIPPQLNQGNFSKAFKVLGLQSSQPAKPTAEVADRALPLDDLDGDSSSDNNYGPDDPYGSDDDVFQEDLFDSEQSRARESPGDATANQFNETRFAVANAIPAWLSGFPPTTTDSPGAFPIADSFLMQRMQQLFLADGSSRLSVTIVDVRISEAARGSTPFALYLLQVRSGLRTWMIQRRYREFAVLHRCLESGKIGIMSSIFASSSVF